MSEIQGEKKFYTHYQLTRAKTKSFSNKLTYKMILKICVSIYLVSMVNLYQFLGLEMVVAMNRKVGSSSQSVAPSPQSKQKIK